MPEKYENIAPKSWHSSQKVGTVVKKLAQYHRKTGTLVSKSWHTSIVDFCPDSILVRLFRQKQPFFYTKRPLGTLTDYSSALVVVVCLLFRSFTRQKGSEMGIMARRLFVGQELAKKLAH